MTAKKKWLKKIYHDSQDFYKYSQPDISWSSSESDDEMLTKKKKVQSEGSINKKWIVSNLKDENAEKVCQSTKRGTFSASASPFKCPQAVTNNCNLNKCSSEVYQISVNSPDHLHKTNNQTECVSNKILNSFCESPIINDFKLEELSPVLNQTSKDCNKTEKTSPILGNKRVLKKIHSKIKPISSTRQPVDENSPDLFETQSTQVIEDDSPDIKFNLPMLKSQSSQSSEYIGPFPSQHSSQVIDSNTDSSVSVKDNATFYHQPAPKKKSYKKGGLASLLQKTLNLQSTRISIWQHEIYMKRNDIGFDQGDVIDFVVKDKRKEYGNTILECNLLQPKETISFIIIGFNTNVNFIFEVNKNYKLFPPYNVKTIIYKSNEVSCYFNATKFISCKL